ncbi:hypothetical protein ACFVUS_12830 [Nocardia sp. NPDC058058]|uniref:hypothetical protein n=1 Tax=Nocardia sp. NPDC058058 TaxID=3346317 RepID=UPI0036DD6353
MKIAIGGAVCVALAAGVLAGCSTSDDKASPSTTTTSAATAIGFRSQVQALADTVSSPQSGFWTPEEFITKFCKQYASKPGSTQRMVAKDLALGAAVASNANDAKGEAAKQEPNALALVSSNAACAALPRG